MYHYLITVHTGVGKESGTTSNVSFVLSGESADSGVRKLTDGKLQVSSDLISCFILDRCIAIVSHSRICDKSSCRIS